MRDRHKCLNRCRKGARLRIVSLECSSAERQRFCAMGLFPGRRVILVESNSSGSSIVRTEDTRLILDSISGGSVICEENHFFCS